MNLIMTYFFGFLTIGFGALSIFHLWWFFVFFAFDKTEPMWLVASILLWVVAFITSVFTDKFEDRLNEESDEYYLVED